MHGSKCDGDDECPLKSVLLMGGGVLMVMLDLFLKNRGHNGNVPIIEGSPILSPPNEAKIYNFSVFDSIYVKLFVLTLVLCI